MVTGIGRPGKKQVCEGNQGFGLGLFELPKVRLSGQLVANIWILREDRPRDVSRESRIHRRIQASGLTEIT